MLVGHRVGLILKAVVIQRDEFDDAMERSAGLYEALAQEHADDASYAVSLAYKVRFMMHAPRRGLYRLFLQFRHAGAVRTVAFTREVTG